MIDQSKNPYAPPGTWVGGEQKEPGNVVSGPALEAVVPLINFLIASKAAGNSHTYALVAYKEMLGKGRLVRTESVLEHLTADTYINKNWGKGRAEGKWQWTQIDLASPSLRPPELTAEDKAALNKYVPQMKKHLAAVQRAMDIQDKIDSGHRKKYMGSADLPLMADVLDDLSATASNPDHRMREGRLPDYHSLLCWIMPHLRAGISKAFLYLPEPERQSVYQARDALDVLTQEHEVLLRKMTHAALYRHVERGVAAARCR